MTGMSSSEHSVEQLPYWQINVPPNQRTEQCPDFLQDVSEKDLSILSIQDEDYRRSSWDEVRGIIARNDLASFRRVPSDLRRYLEFKSNIQRQYDSMLKYVQQERLHWPSVAPSGCQPFGNPSDYKILRNDWPYGIDTNITHLVIWTKFQFEVDAITDDITPCARNTIENFIIKAFCDSKNGGIDRSRVIWFKNWTILKSVDGIEHFHVMLHEVNKDFVNRITQDGNRFNNIEIGEITAME